MRRPTDIPERDGARLVVYSNSYEGDVWECNHDLATNRILVNVTDNDLNDILPKKVFKLDNNNAVISFSKSVSGRASLFKVTPLLKGNKISAKNKTFVRYRHDLHTTYLICQCWRDGEELVLPEEVIVEDLDLINIYFHKPFTGYIELITPYPRQHEIDNESKIWLDMYRSDLNQNLILTQTWANYSLFLPKTVERIGETKFQRGIKATLHKAEVGDMNSIIHGYRI